MKAWRRQARMTGGLGVAAAVVVLDQITKLLAMNIVPGVGSVIDVAPFLKLVHVYNTGVSFGLLSSDSAIGPWLLSGMGAAVCIVLLVWMYRERNRWQIAALGMIIGGAAGNIIDRLRFGAVFDFIYLHVDRWGWPAFNIADSAITVGVATLLLLTLMRPSRAPKLAETSELEDQ